MSLSECRPIGKQAKLWCNLDGIIAESLVARDLNDLRAPFLWLDQVAVKPASMLNTDPIVDAAPGELSQSMPDAISSGVLDLPKG